MGILEEKRAVGRPARSDKIAALQRARVHASCMERSPSAPTTGDFIMKAGCEVMRWAVVHDMDGGRHLPLLEWNSVLKIKQY
jgi:hypothetical protein